jgi:hypothetical protein
MLRLGSLPFGALATAPETSERLSHARPTRQSAEVVICHVLGLSHS